MSRIHTAHHEAGHFVLRWVLDPSAHQESISIEPDEWSRGRVVGETHDVFLQPPQDVVDAEVIGALAGYYATLRYDPFAPDAAHGASGDFLDANLIMHRMARNPTELRRIRIMYHARTRALVDEHWSKITLIARHLLAFDEVDGDVAATLLGAFGGDEEMVEGLATCADAGDEESQRALSTLRGNEQPSRRAAR